MTLKEAIDNLTAMLGTYLPSEPQDEPDALKLGIEAVKRVQADRTGYETYAPDLLPGETEE